MFPEFDNPLWSIWTQVSRPSRYCGNELRFSRSGLWDDKEALRFCLAFPDVYEIGMSYYGFQLLVPFLEGLGVAVDRAYCPWTDMERLLRERGLPLASTANALPLSNFDVVGFTLQHELSYTNILTMLDLGGIPLRAADRKDAHPLVVAGGPGAFVPEVMAPFIDLFCIGEGEAVLPRLLSVLRRSRGEKRAARLLECAAVPGVLVPGQVHPEYGDGGVSFRSSVPLPVKRQWVADFDALPLPESLIVPSVNTVHDRVAVELFRGCSRGCRFCQAGMTHRPVRERRSESVVEGVRKLIARTGWEEAGLLSLASCDYSGIESVIETLVPYLQEKGVSLGLPSLRMDGFSVDLAARLQKVRRGGLTFAPEAGTQRLRDVINKGITEEAIFASVDLAFSRGWDRIKLYFMMGLPTEVEEDLAGIVGTAQSILRRARKYNRKRASVSVSVAGFVPKPHTPFQWERQNSVQEFREKGRYLKALVKDRALSLNYHEPEQSFLEGVLARGDRRLAEVVERAWRKGARFDGWSEGFCLERWMEAFEECGLDPHDYARERGEDEGLPWDLIDVGVSGAFLRRERGAAYAARVSPDCRAACGACGLDCFSAGGATE